MLVNGGSASPGPRDAPEDLEHREADEVQRVMQSRRHVHEVVTRCVNLHGKWHVLCKLFGHFERLIWPLCRSHALHFELMFANRAI